MTVYMEKVSVLNRVLKEELIDKMTLGKSKN